MQLAQQLQAGKRRGWVRVPRGGCRGLTASSALTAKSSVAPSLQAVRPLHMMPSPCPLDRGIA